MRLINRNGERLAKVGGVWVSTYSPEAKEAWIEQRGRRSSSSARQRGSAAQRDRSPAPAAKRSINEILFPGAHGPADDQRARVNSILFGTPAERFEALNSRRGGPTARCNGVTYYLNDPAQERAWLAAEAADERRKTQEAGGFDALRHGAGRLRFDEPVIPPQVSPGASADQSEEINRILFGAPSRFGDGRSSIRLSAEEGTETQRVIRARERLIQAAREHDPDMIRAAMAELEAALDEQEAQR